MLKFEQKLLIIGCGGGYDIFCGLPIYFGQIRDSLDRPLLANYSFSNNELLKRGQQIGGSESALYKIDASSFELPSLAEFVKEISGGQDIPDWLLKQLGVTKETYDMERCNGTSVNGKLYFPEYELSKELGVPVYAFHGDLGGFGVRVGIRALIALESVNTIIAVDGGTDSLMRGDEPSVGTPHEDMLTLSVIDTLNKEIPTLKSYLYLLGYNIDRMHDVTNSSVQERILDLIKLGGFLGASHLLNDPQSAYSYMRVFERCSPENSWINSLVCASLVGRKEPISLLNRGPSKLPISPFMAIYFGFDLPIVVSQKLWKMSMIAASRTDDEVCDLIKDLLLK